MEPVRNIGNGYLLCDSWGSVWNYSFHSGHSKRNLVCGSVSYKLSYEEWREQYIKNISRNLSPFMCKNIIGDILTEFKIYFE